jgi:hypothetical protein
MFLDWTSIRIFVRPGATDLRKQINGLAARAWLAVADTSKRIISSFPERTNYNSSGRAVKGGVHRGGRCPPRLHHCSLKNLWLTFSPSALAVSTMYLRTRARTF